MQQQKSLRKLMNQPANAIPGDDATLKKSTGWFNKVDEGRKARFMSVDVVTSTATASDNSAGVTIDKANGKDVSSADASRASTSSTKTTSSAVTTTSIATAYSRSGTGGIQKDRFDATAGLLYRRPSYEALNQNELSKSRHRLRAATLPALLRRLTSLSESTRDDSWAFLCRARSFCSPVHLISYFASRFFLDTYRPTSQCHPYNVLAAVNRKGKNFESGRKARRRELLHMINIHPKSRVPVSKSGERLWLLKTEHVLGPEDSSDGEGSIDEQIWEHTVLLPIRCAVLSILDVYLAHFGFDFNNTIAGGSVGLENDILRTEVASSLRQFLVDVADSGSLKMWGWVENTIYSVPETDCPAMFAQFPALSCAICAAVAADRSSRQTANKLFLTSEQMEKLTRVLKKNPSFVGRTSMEEASSVNDSGGGSHFLTDSFASNSAKASALAISEECLSVMASQATCVIAAEHRLSSESFRHVHDVAPPKKMLVNSVDKIILAMAIGGVDEPQAGGGIDTSGGDYVNSGSVARSATEGAGAAKPGANDGTKTGTLYKQTKYTRKWESRTVTLSALGKLSWNGGPLHQGYITLNTECNASSASEASIGRKYGIFIETQTRKISFACNHESERDAWLKAIAKHTGSGHHIHHTLGAVISEAGRDLTKAINREGSYRRASMLMKMIGQNSKDALVPTGFASFGADAVAKQITLHLFYLFVAIPLREFTLDLSFKHSKASEETYGQPHLARFRNESERIPSIIVSMILETSTPTARGGLIAFLVQVCDLMLEMRSYHGCMLILSALQSNPIHRLKKSWQNAYTFSYTIERGDGVPKYVGGNNSSRGGNNSSRGGNNSIRGGASAEEGPTPVKEGYAKLLEIAGIGGRNLPNLVHKELSSLNHSSENNFGNDSSNHRIAFPDAPSLPIMPFVNASLGTLIRLNELPDEVSVEEIMKQLEGDGDPLAVVSNGGGGMKKKKEQDKAAEGGGYGDKKGGKKKKRGIKVWGSSNYYKDRDAEQMSSLLNLSKMRRVAAIIATMRACQLTPFVFQPRVDIQYHLMKDYMFIEAEDQYQKSLVIEGADYAI
jgi:hypothetical protein